MPAMGKGILLSGLSLGFCEVSLSRWTKAHDLLCQQKIQKFQIAQVVRESNAMLRWAACSGKCFCQTGMGLLTKRGWKGVEEELVALRVRGDLAR